MCDQDQLVSLAQAELAVCPALKGPKVPPGSPDRPVSKAVPDHRALGVPRYPAQLERQVRPAPRATLDSKDLTDRPAVLDR